LSDPFSPPRYAPRTPPGQLRCNLLQLSGKFIEFDMGMYAVGVLGMTFFYGAIIRISGKAGVFLSVLAHTLTNMVLGGFPFNPTWLGAIVTFIVMVGVAMFTVSVYERKRKSFA